MKSCHYCPIDSHGVMDRSCSTAVMLYARTTVAAMFVHAFTRLTYAVKHHLKAQDRLLKARVLESEIGAHQTLPLLL